jgi:glycerophosphoryl diester phosphodiesterase
VGTKVSKITINGESIVLKDKISQLTATVTPTNASNKKIIWTSSDESVVRVNGNGKVAYMSDGKATITATSTDGAKKIGKFTVNAQTIFSESSKFIAHRGLSAVAPENTLPAFELACEAGFWGVECDIWETASESPTDPDDGDDTNEDDGSDNDPEAPPEYDRELMISHDRSLLKMTGQNFNITSLTSGAIKGMIVNSGNNIENYPDLRILTLDEYLEILEPYDNVNAVIEVKGAYPKSISKEGITRMLDLIDDHDMTDRATVISFSTESLKEIINQSEQRDQSNGRVKTMLLLNNLLQNDMIISANVAWAYKYNIDGVSIAGNLLTADVVAMAHSLKMEVCVWTVDDSLKAMKFIIDKVDYLTSSKVLFKKTK